MTNTYKITDKQVQTKITSIKGRGKTLQSDVQSAILLAIEHAQEREGDFTMLTTLYHALPKMVRRATFKAYVQSISPCSFRTITSKGGAKIKLFKKVTSDNAVAYDLNPQSAWYDFEPEKGDNEADPLTLEEIQAQIRKYVKTLKTKNEGNSNIVSYLDTLAKAVEA